MSRNPVRSPQREPAEIMFFMVLVALLFGGIAAAISATIGAVAEPVPPAREASAKAEAPAQWDQTFYVLAHHWGFSIFTGDGTRLDAITVPQGTVLELYAVNALAGEAIEALPPPVAEAMRTVSVPDAQAILATEPEPRGPVEDHGFLIDWYGVVEYLSADALEPRRVVFKTDRPGEFEFVCTNYCGVGHIQMHPVKLVVQPAGLATAAPTLQEGHVGLLTPTPTLQKDGTAKQGQADLGRRIFTGEASGVTVACSVCHQIGRNGAGPDLGGVAARAVHRVAGLTDREYLKQSILEPGAYVAEGWPAIMPGYQGQLTGEQLNAIVDYLMTLE